MPAIILITLSYRVKDVCAVHQTTVAITDDECMFVCGKYKGGDVTVPMKIKTGNPRDIFTKGQYPSTGGCVRFSKYMKYML